MEGEEGGKYHTYHHNNLPTEKKRIRRHSGPTHTTWWGCEAETWCPIQTKHEDFRTRHGTRCGMLCQLPGGYGQAFPPPQIYAAFHYPSLFSTVKWTQQLSLPLFKHALGRKQMLLFLALYSVRGNQHLCKWPSAKICKTKATKQDCRRENTREVFVPYPPPSSPAEVISSDLLS